MLPEYSHAVELGRTGLLSDANARTPPAHYLPGRLRRWTRLAEHDAARSTPSQADGTVARRRSALATKSGAAAQPQVHGAALAAMRRLQRRRHEQRHDRRPGVASAHGELDTVGRQKAPVASSCCRDLQCRADLLHVLTQRRPAHVHDLAADAPDADRFAGRHCEPEYASRLPSPQPFITAKHRIPGRQPWSRQFIFSELWRTSAHHSLKMFELRSSGEI